MRDAYCWASSSGDDCRPLVWHAARIVSRFATPGLFSGSNDIPCIESVVADRSLVVICSNVSVSRILDLILGADFDIF